MMGGRPAVSPPPLVTNVSEAEHGVETMFSASRPLFLVVHQEFAVAEVLALFLALGRDEKARIAGSSARGVPSGV